MQKKYSEKEFTKNQETYAVKKTLPKYYRPSNSKDNCINNYNFKKYYNTIKFKR
jgi:hypothetical protein